MLIESNNFGKANKEHCFNRIALCKTESKFKRDLTKNCSRIITSYE